MNNIEAIRAIKRIELKINHDDFILKGEDTYLIYRNHIFSLLIGKQRDRKGVKTNSEIWRKGLKKIVHVLINSKKYILYKLRHSMLNRKECDVLLFSSIYYRRVKVGKFHYNPFTDPIIEFLDSQNVSNVLFEFSDNHDGFDKNYLKKTFTNQSSIIIPQIKSMFCRNLSLIEIRKISESVKKLNKLLKKYEVEINIGVISKRLSLFFYLKQTFKNKLVKLSPKLIFLVCYYNYDGFALIAAANDIGIKTYDIQHGYLGKYHKAYGILDKNKPINSLKPTGYIVQSNKDKKALLEYQNVKNEDIIVTGRIFDRFLKDKIKGTNIDERLDSLKKRSSNTIVLITLQYGIGLDEKLKYILTNANEKKINWWIRMHPNMKEFEKEKVFLFLSNSNINNVDIEEPSNLPLELLFPLIDLQITHFSSTALDGLKYGVKTFLINPVVKEYFRQSIKENLLLDYVEDLNKLIDQLEHEINNVDIDKISINDKEDVNNLLSIL